MTPLGTALKKLYDDLGLTLDSWAEIFNSDNPEVQRWFTGESGPNARQLRGIKDICDRSGFAIKELDLVLDMPALEAVGNRPWGGCFPPFGRTLRHYMISTLYAGLVESIKTLEPDEQEKLIYKVGKEIREMRGQKNLSRNTQQG